MKSTKIHDQEIILEKLHHVHHTQKSHIRVLYSSQDGAIPRAYTQPPALLIAFGMHYLSVSIVGCHTGPTQLPGLPSHSEESVAPMVYRVYQFDWSQLATQRGIPIHYHNQPVGTYKPNIHNSQQYCTSNWVMKIFFLKFIVLVIMVVSRSLFIINNNNLYHHNNNKSRIFIN